MKENLRETAIIAVGSALIILGAGGGLILLAWTALGAWNIFQGTQGALSFALQFIVFTALYTATVSALAYLASILQPDEKPKLDTLSNVMSDPDPSDWEMKIIWNTRGNAEKVSELLATVLDERTRDVVIHHAQNPSYDQPSLYADSQTIQRLARNIKGAGMDADIIPH